MMNTRHLTQQQRFDIIMECRKSGLSDYQWCMEHDIKPGTFCNWITRFRKKGYPNIPESTRREIRPTPEVQEVVKIDFLPNSPSSDFEMLNSKSESIALVHNNTEATIEIIHNDSVFKINNNISPQLLDMLLVRIGGVR